MPTQFAFLVLPQLHLLDLAGADQSIHEAIDYGADFSITYCGINQDVVTTSGLPFGTLPSYDQITLAPGDYLIIPGSSYTYLTSPEFLKNEKLFQWIISHYEQGVILCSICIGAFVLAETGLLNDKFCTTHFKKAKELQERFPKLKVQENILFTEEDRIYTSAGIAAGIDLILYIIEQLKGSYFSHLVARELVVYHRRNGNASQESELLNFRNHIHSGIHKVQDYILNHISRKTNLADLAEIATMSERNFTRIFKKETGITVNAYITSIRKAKAQELLKNPDLSNIEIANKVGFQSEKQLRRILNGKA